MSKKAEKQNINKGVWNSNYSDILTDTVTAFNLFSLHSLFQVQHEDQHQPLHPQPRHLGHHYVLLSVEQVTHKSCG